MEITGTRGCRRWSWWRWCAIGSFRSSASPISRPSTSSKTRYFVKRLRAALPELRIAVGRWAPPALADDSAQPLVEAGANHVASTLVESRDYLGGLLDMPRVSAPETTGVETRTPSAAQA